MSITDELRQWVRDGKGSLLGIADRIDAEHERECKEQYACGVEHGIGAPTEAQLEELGYIALPKDADGVPIRVGDKVEYLTGGRDVVRFLTLNGSGWTVNERGWEPFTMHHHHAPTVEDVLREFHERMTELGTTDQCVGVDRDEAVDALLRERAELVAEYAAKLRLAEEVDA